MQAQGVSEARLGQKRGRHSWLMGCCDSPRTCGQTAILSPPSCPRVRLRAAQMVCRGAPGQGPGAGSSVEARGARVGETLGTKTWN